jgi:hypothetical protein
MSEILTKSELEEIQAMLNSFNKLKIQLADTELAKRAIIDNIDQVRERYLKLEEGMSLKYGNGDSIRINVETGEIEQK